MLEVHMSTTTALKHCQPALSEPEQITLAGYRVCIRDAYTLDLWSVHRVVCSQRDRQLFHV